MSDDKHTIPACPAPDVTDEMKLAGVAALLDLGCDPEVAEAEALIVYEAMRRLDPSYVALERDARRWRGGVKLGFPHFTRQIYPDVNLPLGWRTPSQGPPNGVTHNPVDYPYYKTAEEAMDSAIDQATGRQE